MKKEIDIFDKPKNIKIMLALFYIVLVVLIVLDPFMEHDSYFGFDGHVGFYAAFGFVACVMVITISKILRFFLIRDESYYDN